MVEKIKEIHAFIKDYRNDDGIELTENDITAWVNQFDVEDRAFVASELVHLLSKGIYVSKEKAQMLLRENLKAASRKLGYGTDYKLFVAETHFLNVRPKGKSQSVLFDMLNDIVNEALGVNLNHNTEGIKSYIYLDDIVATGRTTLIDTENWLKELGPCGSSNLERLKAGEIRYVVSVFCHHRWGWETTVKWLLKSKFEEDFLYDKIELISNVTVDNQVLYPYSTLNLAYPSEALRSIGDPFIQQLAISPTNHESRRYRLPDRPFKETLFSSPENRNRFESILLQKGIEILSKVSNTKGQHRPFGDTFPSYATLGTGTLFFTWRNISNTCPLVFWWDVPAHQWSGLFPLQNRGN